MPVNAYAQHKGQKASVENKAKHIAIIMDGNGRWAKARQLSRTQGHRKGVETVRNIIRACIENQVQYLTLFAFGVENYKRPTREVRNLFRLFLLGTTKELPFLRQHNIRLNVIGDRSKFPFALQKAIEHAENQTRLNTQLTINLAVNFSGRWDLLNAISKLIKQSPGQSVTEQDLNQALSLANIPEPDLLIRTGGVQRLSNFLLWDLAYTELFFSPTLWPDFNQAELTEILQDFSLRERRYGLTGDQLEC